jgi:BMFP domain-containing protein YqiC
MNTTMAQPFIDLEEFAFRVAEAPEKVKLALYRRKHEHEETRLAELREIIIIRELETTRDERRAQLGSLASAWATEFKSLEEDELTDTEEELSLPEITITDIKDQFEAVKSTKQMLDCQLQKMDLSARKSSNPDHGMEFPEVVIPRERPGNEGDASTLVDQLKEILEVKKQLCKNEIQVVRSVVKLIKCDYETVRELIECDYWIRTDWVIVDNVVQMSMSCDYLITRDEPESQADMKIKTRRYRTMEAAAKKLEKESKSYLDSLRGESWTKMKLA